ncbi:MAG: hypothetical protein P9M06_06230 [Candidatus Saelkia tenebricola]|nr:hypothetical protein [Candidatus Saelkia tenebricola]
MKVIKKIVLILAIILLLPDISFARRIRSSLNTPEIHMLLPLIVGAITSQDKEELRVLISENPTLSSKSHWNNLFNNLDKDSWKADTYCTLAITSNRIREYRDAVEYYKQASEEFKILDMFENAGTKLKQASFILKEKLICYDEAIALIIEAAECFKEAGNHLMAGNTYSWAIDLTINNVTKHDDSQWLFDTYLACAQCFENGEDYKKASVKYKSAAYLSAQKLHNPESSVLYNVKSAECALKAAENLLVKANPQDALLMLKSAVKNYAQAARTSKVILKNKSDFAFYSSLVAQSYYKIAELYNQTGEVVLEKKAWIETTNYYLIAMQAYIASNNRPLAEDFRIQAALILENIGMFEEAEKLFR